MSDGYRWDSGELFALASDSNPLGWVSVTDYGAVGDGVSDDTAAINAAAAVANAVTARAEVYVPLGVLHFTAGRTYRTTAALDPWLCNVMASGARIMFDPADNTSGTAVTLGDDGSSPFPADMLVYFPAVRKKNIYWTSSLTGTDIGIKMIGIPNAEIHISSVRDFSIGVLATGSATNVNPAFTYNEVHIRHLDNNKINLKLSDGGMGYCNENNWYGGHFSHDSNMGTNISGARHILIETTPTVHSYPNNNAFHKPSIEGNGSEYHLECQGPYNGFYQARWEAATPKCYFNGANAQGNFVSYGYGSFNIVFTQANGAYGNHVQTQRFYAVGGLGGASGVIRVGNTSSNDDPAIVVADTTADVLVDDLTTMWRTAMGGSSIAAKALADSDFAVRLHTSGKLEFGDRAGAVAAAIQTGLGNPEGSVIGATGSLYMRQDGPVHRKVYVKTSGSGNTGWAPCSLLPLTTVAESDTNITPNADYESHSWSPTTSRTVAAPTATEPLVGQRLTFDISNAGVSEIEPVWDAAFKVHRRFALAAP